MAVIESSAVEVATTLATTSTTVATVVETTSSTTTTTEPEPSLSVLQTIDRGVLLSSIIVADVDGNLLGTQLDPESAGCEGAPSEYFVTLRADGRINPTAANGEPIHYTSGASVSPRGDQILVVDTCEGFLSEVEIYDLDGDLALTEAITVDSDGALSGDAAWTADGFIAMMLSDIHAFYSEPEGEVEEQTELQVREYLVNPRTGERTESGMLETFHFGAVRTFEGQLVYTEFDEGPAVVLESRNGAQRRFDAGGFQLGPEGRRLLVWDSIFDEVDEPRLELVDLVKGTTSVLARAAPFRAIWSADGARFAFTDGRSAFVYDIGSGELLDVGEPEEDECSADESVRWGRVPLEFAPNGDLYVGDAVCGASSEGLGTVQYRVRQMVLSQPGT